MATRTTCFSASTSNTAACCVGTGAFGRLIFESGRVFCCYSCCVFSRVFGRVFGRVLGRVLLISHEFHCLAGSNTCSYWLYIITLTGLRPCGAWLGCWRDLYERAQCDA